MSDDASDPPDQASAVEQQQVIKEGDSAPKTKADKEAAQALNEFSRTEDNGQLSMRVHVYSPFRDYYDDQAFSITAENTTGPFDILPRHHNFISLLSPCELLLRTVRFGDRRIRISGGIMHVKADRVIVFLDV